MMWGTKQACETMTLGPIQTGVACFNSYEIN